MLIVGLTGGIASGKSAVARILQQMGSHVIEADLVAHEFLKSANPVSRQIVAEFGPQILGPSGEIDRARLGEIVFGDSQKLARLNALTHPPVLREIAQQLDALSKSAPESVAIVVAALHVESGYYKSLDRLAVAWCTPDQQLARLLGRGCTREQAERRIASQLTLDEKRRLADDVIDCSQTLEHTQTQVRDLLARWQQLASAH